MEQWGEVGQVFDGNGGARLQTKRNPPSLFGRLAGWVESLLRLAYCFLGIDQALQLSSILFFFWEQEVAGSNPCRPERESAV
jgi:hypothetical protein